MQVIAIILAMILFVPETPAPLITNNPAFLVLFPRNKEKYDRYTTVAVKM